MSDDKEENFMMFNFGIDGYIEGIYEKHKLKDDALMKFGNQSTFWISSQPKLSLKGYMERLKHYIPFEDSTVVIAALYIQRLVNKGYILTSNNMHRFMAIALFIARKYNEEKRSISLRRFAQAAGLHNEVVVKLEFAFCYLLEWKLYCKIEDLLFFISEQANELPGETGLQYVHPSSDEL